MPGIAASTSETCELASPPNSVEAPENNLACEVTWACTSKPITTSQSPVAPLISFDFLAGASIANSRPVPAASARVPCPRALQYILTKSHQGSPRKVEDLSRSDKGAIERLAAWLAPLRVEDFSQRTVERAKLLLLDTLGCGFAALDDDCARAVLATLDALGEKPQCTVLGHPRGMSAPSAVLGNGTLIRVLDLNDYVVGAHPQSGARGGPPRDNIPFPLAAAELAKSSGRDLLAAIVLAYEIYGRGKALMDADSIWDGVSISGIVAPAVAGWLLRLPQHKLAHGIALSAARAATPVAVREGGISAAKNIAHALGGPNGMQATLLAEQGLTGPLDLF